MTSRPYSNYSYVHSNSSYGNHGGNGVASFGPNALREFSCMVLDRANDVYQSRYIGYPMMLEYRFPGAYHPHYQFPSGRFHGYCSAPNAMPNLKADKAQLLCPVCYRNFNRESTLKVHMRIHSGEKPFECSDCGKRFSQSGNLTVHRRIHNGIRPYACRICDRTFIQSSSLTSHIRSHLRIQSKNITEASGTAENNGADMELIENGEN